MTSYAYLKSGAILRGDGAVIPVDPANSDYQQFLLDVAAGAVATPYTPSPAEIAAQAQQTADAADVATARANAVIAYLVNHTPAQCVAKVNTDVVDLASAKIMLGNFAVALCVLARDKLR